MLWAGLRANPNLATLLLGTLPRRGVTPARGRAARGAADATAPRRPWEAGMNLPPWTRAAGFTRHGRRPRRRPSSAFRTRPGQCRARSLGGACGERDITTARDRADRQPRQPDSISWGGLRGGRRQECTLRHGGGADGQTGRRLVTQDAFAPGRVPVFGTFTSYRKPSRLHTADWRILLAAREFMRSHS